MPKSTFFKLPEEKRNEILSKAGDILLESSYEITITEMLKLLNMPTGTFYRYFEDKDDLVIQVLDASRKPFPFREDLLLRPPFENVSDMKISESGRKRARLFASLPPEVLQRYYFGKNKEYLVERYRKALQKLKYDGVLRDDADPEFLAFMYATTLFNFEMYCREHDIKNDDNLVWKMKKYFYFSFFKYGIMNGEHKTE